MASLSINEEWEEIRARLVRSYFEDYSNVIPDSDPEDSWAGSSDKISPPTPILDFSPSTLSPNSIPKDSWVKTSKRLLSSSKDTNPISSPPESTPFKKRPCSPLPELIIERVKEDPNKYDEPEEFYEQLAKDVTKYMKRLEKGDCSFSDFEREESQDLGDDFDNDASPNPSLTSEPQIGWGRSYDDEVDDEVDSEVDVDVDDEITDEVDDEVDDEVNGEVDDEDVDEVNDEINDEGMQVDSEADSERQPTVRTSDIGIQCKIKDNRIGLFFSGTPTITKLCRCENHDFLRRV